MKKLSNRMLALAMSLCMIFTMMPMAAHATESQETYTVYLNSYGGSGTLSGAGSYAVGTTVTITATPADGCCLYMWGVSGSTVTLANNKATTTTFTMPASDVTITANFRTHDEGWKTTDNEHWKVCLFCGEVAGTRASHSYTDDTDTECECGWTREVHTHDYSDATCTTPATCDCGETTGDVDKSNHTGGTEIRNAKEATETENGYTGDTYCKGCGDKLSDGETIPATHTHSYTPVVTAPTCSDRGYTTYTCSCNDSYVSDYVDALGHDWGEWKNTQNGAHARYCKRDTSHDEVASCSYKVTETGVSQHKLTCPECGDYAYVYHEFVNVDGDPHTVICTVCEKEVTDNHSLTSYRYDSTNHWGVCGCGQGIAGSVKAHTLVDKYDNNGHWKECAICDYYSDLQSHVYSNDSDTSCNDCGYVRHVHVHEYSTAATCTSPARCSCGATTGSKAPSNHVGGTEIRNAKEATETENGYTGDTYCKGCGAKLASGERTNPLGFVDVKYDDDVVVKEVTFQPIKGVTLPDDAEVVVKDYTATLAPIESLLWRDVEAEYITVADNDIYVSDPPVVLNGVTYNMHEIIVINGEEFLVIKKTKSREIGVMRLSDSVEFRFDGERLEEWEQNGLKVEKRENQKLNINGVTYDVVAVYDGFSSLDESILYYKGQPAGAYRFKTGIAFFNEGYDPATLAAQQDDDFLGRVTADNTAIADLTPGTTYNAYVVGANDIHLEGAENVGGTVTQTFEVPSEFIGNESVKYAAVHLMNPYAAARDEAYNTYQRISYELYVAERQYENGEISLEEFNKVKLSHSQAHDEFMRLGGLYNAWEKENAAGTETGNEFGTVTVAADGKTITATYEVDSFSPFIIYAFVEADEPEIKTLSATIVDGSDDVTEPVVSADPIPKEGGYAWLWIVVAILAAGAAITIVIYTKKKKK